MRYINHIRVKQYKKYCWKRHAENMSNSGVRSVIPVDQISLLNKYMSCIPITGTSSALDLLRDKF